MKDSTVEQMGEIDRALRKSEGKAIDQNGKQVTVVVTAVLNKATDDVVVGYSVERPGNLHYIYVGEDQVLRWTELKVVDNINLQGLPSNDVGRYIGERNRATAGLAFGAIVLSHVKLVTNDGRAWSAPGVFEMGEYEKLLAQMKRNRELWYPVSAYLD